MRLLRIFPTVAAVASVFSLSLPAAQAAAGTAVTGRVSNGTAGSSQPKGLVVTVVQLDKQNGEVARKEADVSGDGAFRVEGFSPASGGRYVVGTDYQGVTYSIVVDDSGAAQELHADVKVFETTSDDSVIAISSDILTVVKGTADRLEVIQLLRIVNSSDRTYAGRSGQVLRFPLPAGAFDVAPMEGLTASKLIDGAEGFISQDPVVPGTTEVSYFYRIRTARSGWSMQRSVVYPTDHVDVLAGPGLSLVASDLRFAEKATLGGRAYKRWRGGPFRSGAVVEAGFGFISGGSTSGLYWGTAAGLLAALLVAGFASLHMRRRKRVPAPVETHDRPRLIEEIARLDEGFASGAIAEDEYRERRQTLKSRLEEIPEPTAAK